MSPVKERDAEEIELLMETNIPDSIEQCHEPVKQALGKHEDEHANGGFALPDPRHLALFLGQKRPQLP